MFLSRIGRCSSFTFSASKLIAVKNTEECHCPFYVQTPMIFGFVSLAVPDIVSFLRILQH